MWQVKIDGGKAKGTYNMPSKREAEEFTAAWRADSQGDSASATILRPSGIVHMRLHVGLGV